MENNKSTVVLYHANCPDGFGAAYAAWKKFGEEAEYIPVKHGADIPEETKGNNVLLLDYCFPKEKMSELKQVAKSIIVLDHHEGVRDVATKYEGVFDPEYSGATIAWRYFHPDQPTPLLLSYLEDGDLFKYSLSETSNIFALLEVYPYEFSDWDNLVTKLENESDRKDVLAKASAYREYFEKLGAYAADKAKKVKFEGYDCYFATSHPSITMKSYVGNLLYKELPPIAIVVTAHPEGFGVSLRSDGTVDVSEIARKYGGNGHPGAAGFTLNAGESLPWEMIEDEE